MKWQASINKVRILLLPVQNPVKKMLINSPVQQQTLLTAKHQSAFKRNQCSSFMWLERFSRQVLQGNVSVIAVNLEMIPT